MRYSAQNWENRDLGHNKLTKLGRCSSYAIEWLNKSTARLRGLLEVQARTAKLIRMPELLGPKSASIKECQKVSKSTQNRAQRIFAYPTMY